MSLTDRFQTDNLQDFVFAHTRYREAAISGSTSVEYGGLIFERFGHASVRIETDDGRVLYIDPWSGVLADDPRDGDVVFVTRDDPDHYDPAGIDAVASPDATVVAYEAIDTTELDRDVVDLEYGGSLTVDGIDVEALPAHDSADGPRVDEDGAPFHAEGEVIGLLLDVDGTTAYFTSDTDFLSEHGDSRAYVFIPPIGGHFTIDRHEAANFAGSVDADLVFLVHYDTFEAIETDAEAFVNDLETRGITVDLFWIREIVIELQFGKLLLADREISLLAFLANATLDWRFETAMEQEELGTIERLAIAEYNERVVCCLWCVWQMRDTDGIVDDVIAEWCLRRWDERLAEEEATAERLCVVILRNGQGGI